MVWTPEYSADTKCQNCVYPYWLHSGKEVPHCAPGLCPYPRQDKRFAAVEGSKRLEAA